MYKEHPAMAKPSNEDIRIWRFIDFTKYVSLLETNSLYFNRSDLFDDIFEGSFPKPTIDSINQNPSLDEQTKSSIIQALRQSSENLPKVHFLNCWHMNEYESDAMWKLYTSGRNGVAIQSSFKRLTQCFEEALPYVYVGLVNYIDYNTHVFPFDNSFYLFMHKRQSFRHEHELRALILNSQNLREATQPFITGINVKVNLDKLIEKIYVSPQAPNWFKDLVKSITEKYNIAKPIESSSLDERPLFR